MRSFYNHFKTAKHLILKPYRKKAIFFLTASIALLILDIFSIFLLVPLFISFLDPDYLIHFFSIEIPSQYKSLIAIGVLFFFLIKNYGSINLNKKLAKIAYELSSEYTLLLAKHYILGNYTSFKKQKKSSIVKDIIFISNDFVSNILLSINSIFSESLLLLIILSISLYYNPIPSLIILLLLSIIIWVFKRYNHNYLKKINDIRDKDYDNNMNNLTNLINGYLSIKSPTLQNLFLNRFKKSNQQLNQNYALLHSIRTNTSKQTEVILVLILCSVYILLQFFTLEINTTSFLSLSAALLLKAIPSINKLNISFTNFNSHIYSIDILEEKLASIPKNNPNTLLLSFSSSIRLENISFSYELPHYIFQDFNLTINKGDYIGITGKSGIGKTSLLNIIAKLIDSNSGNIYLDNQIIDHTNKYNYFSLITYLTQKPFIYEGSILENILLTNNHYDQDNLQEILKALELDIVLDKLPDGLHTYIGLDGNVLSGGQLQRLSIARALLNPTDILILDEATSNLDKLTEKKVLDYLKAYIKKNHLTVISIAHHIHDNANIYTKIINLENYEV